MNARVIRGLLKILIALASLILLAPGSFLPGTSSSDPENNGAQGVFDFMNSTTTSLNDRLRFTAALAAASSGQKQLAKQYYYQLLANHPNNPVILHNLTCLNK